MSKDDFINAMVRDAERGFQSKAEQKHFEYVVQRTKEQNPKHKITKKGNKIYVRRKQITVSN